MNIVFWQNSISPHQIPYIKHLSEDERIDKVFFVAPSIVSEERLKLGWKVKEYFSIPTIQFILKPSDEKVKELFELPDTYHLFSGIRGSHFVFRCYKNSLKYNLKRGIISEGPFSYKKPILLHLIKFILFDYVYYRKACLLFAIGKAEVFFRPFSSNMKIFPFMYCVEYPNIAMHHEIKDKNVKFVFCGRLIKLKNISMLLDSVKQLAEKYELTLDIYGDGPEKEHIVNKIKKLKLENTVSIRGSYDVRDIYQILNNQDVLVLPSLYDGWGAVINEALSNGNYVVCSEKCGASNLIKNRSELGLVHNISCKNITSKLEICCKNIATIRENRNRRHEWAKNISGPLLSRYMIDSLLSENRITPPWNNLF